MPAARAHLQRITLLAGLDSRDYRDAVFAWIRNERRTPSDAEVFRDSEIVGRTLEALDVLIATTEAGIQKLRSGTDIDRASKIAYRHQLLRALQSERAVVRPLANEEREKVSQLDRGKGARHRAMVRLSKAHPVEFLALVREEQDKDDERARID